MSANPVVWYTPAPGKPGRIRVAPVDLLRMRQLPQLVLLERVEPGALPINVECLEACSPSNNLCVRIGKGANCIRAYTPLLPGLPPAWAGLLGTVEAGKEGREIMMVEGEVSEVRGLRGAFSPRLYYVEPLAVRVIRVEEGEFVLSLGCVEAPGEAEAFLALGEPLVVNIKPGVVMIEGEGVALRASRCSRGLLARLLNSRLRGVKGPLDIRGDIGVLEYRVADNEVTVTLWNPHLHPVTVELHSVYPVARVEVYDANGRHEVTPRHDSTVVHLIPEGVARLQVKLRPLPKLLMRRIMR
ncbi:hypothetical protein Pyrfu_0952 [Pyrolobus fumarii 1A]|uniref:Uncharacterized protein n=1 Tax=Pyrolobus fumarii (strain DSM 11204 / 1A) TaxID=694429 RepID=G0EEC7_PYRF1|nr:hypothetical protein [Pyrolobus fumarii]AEM38821.1 hypothetical protein Pyrfu_0952 [Pyrolobus fumarii 1A]